MPCRANVQLPSLFSDNMVLQRDKPISVWGTADPGEIVGIRFGDQAKIVTADKDGKWLATLPPVAAGGPFTLTVHGKNEVTVKNVMVGEVWLLAGSSNMGAIYSVCEHTEQDTASANLPELRLFKVPENLAHQPLEKTGGDWKLCSSESVQNFSSIGFYIGRELQQKLHVPVGIIQGTFPDAPIETWVSRDATDNASDFKSLGSRSEKAEEEYGIVQGRYEEALAEWDKKCEEARKAHRPEPPTPPLPPPRRMGLVGSAFNGQINPVTPYTMRGMFFYEGENDIAANAGIRWKLLFTVLIKDWRDRFKDPSLPVYYVQLPNAGKRQDKPGESFWAEIREAQAVCRRIPFLYMVATIDTGSGVTVDMHPRDKRMIAIRLAHAALATQYHVAVPYASPIYDSMENLGGKIRLHFRNAEKGLISKGLPVEGFQIAGEDEKFVFANAQTDGETILVSSDKVSKPVAVRYGWADNPALNLYNADKMPVAPFRTDTWQHANPVTTKK